MCYLSCFFVHIKSTLVIVISCSNDEKSVFILITVDLGNRKRFVIGKIMISHVVMSDSPCVFVGAFLSRWLSGVVTVWVLPLNFGLCGSVVVKEGLTC